MNSWIGKSIKLANSQGYLDKLFDVYPVELGKIRDLPDETERKFKGAFKSRNELQLIRSLLEFPKFPIDDPYISSFRRHPHLLEKNPKTIKRLAKRLLSMDYYTILLLATRPKSPTRQLGQSFKNWLRKLNCPFLEEKEFEKENETAFLKGPEKELKKFIARQLGITSLKRRPDFVLKIHNRFIIGESKFLTDYGGTQNNQFDGALEMAKIQTNKVLGIAVLDGIVWLKSNSYMHRTLKEFKGTALSSLLLKEYIATK